MIGDILYERFDEYTDRRSFLNRPAPAVHIATDRLVILCQFYNLDSGYITLKQYDLPRELIKNGVSCFRLENSWKRSENDVSFRRFSPTANFITKDGSFYSHAEYDFRDDTKLTDLFTDMQQATRSVVHLYAERMEKRKEHNQKLGELTSTEFFHRSPQEGLGRLFMDEFHIDGDGIEINAKTDLYDVQIHSSRSGELSFLLKRGKTVKYIPINEDFTPEKNNPEYAHFSSLWAEAMRVLDVDKRLDILRDASKDNYTFGPLLADFMQEKKEYPYWAGRHQRDPGKMFEDSRTEIVAPKEEPVAEPKEQPRQRGFFRRFF